MICLYNVITVKRSTMNNALDMIGRKIIHQIVNFFVRIAFNVVCVIIK